MKLFQAGIALLLALPITLSPARLPDGQPSAVIDLATEEGVHLVKGEWRYSDTKIVNTEFRAPGPDGQPTGVPIQTYDYAPHAGGVDFDDSQWQVIAPGTLNQ